MVSLISISAQAFSVQAEHTGICTYTTLRIGSYQEEFVFFCILFSEKYHECMLGRMAFFT